MSINGSNIKILTSIHFLLVLIGVCFIGFGNPLSVFAENQTGVAAVPAIPASSSAIISIAPPDTTSFVYSQDKAETPKIQPHSLPIAPKIEKQTVKRIANENTTNADSVTTNANATYIQPSLTVSSKTATSLTIKAAYPASGIYGNGLYLYDYTTGQWTDITRTWYTSNGYYTINSLKPSTTYYVLLIWYTDGSNSWLQRSINLNSATYPAVAELSLYATSDGTASSINTSGHAFITVKNTSNANINIGNFSGIAPGKMVSVGTWGNKSEHTGLWYNLEEYFTIKNGSFKNTVALAMPISSNQLESINSYIMSNDYWSLTNNCSSFASKVWNSYSPTKVSAGIPNTPSNLKNSIISKGYINGRILSWDYLVYYAQGTGLAKLSNVYK